ncbi:MAG: tripartite tricarboxylate transporter substrate binding protein [Burkholderiales bacterium]|nr:tripartite tricarboxylate transporter substrate binding protein [Burkholderiales bacterium]
MAMIPNGFRMLVAGFVLFGSAAAAAQGYPAKPIRIIVPFPAAGGTDLMARTMGDKISAALGQQTLVDNRTGAGGTLGSDLAAKAAPDGYTLLVTSSSALVIGPSLMKKAPYDPLRSFSPVMIISSAPNVLVIHPSVPAKNVRELITLARQRPGVFNYASNGAGTLSHLTGELFNQRAGVKMMHVPYRGGPPAVTDTMAGNVSLLFSAYPTVSTQVQSRRLRALAVTSLKRASIAPDLPSIAETLPGFESNQWWGMFGPAGMPPEVIGKLNGVLQQALTMADVRKRLAADAAEPVGGSAADCEKFLREDFEKWRKVIKDAGVEPS